MRFSARMAPLAQGVCVVALAGMAYCHIKDVGMKFDEHVYYMAALFCCNIAMSLALIPALIIAELNDLGWIRLALWSSAVGLAIATIIGFVWSRSFGFPQMADHIGQWDTLGITSLAFEALLIVAGVVLFVDRRTVDHPQP